MPEVIPEVLAALIARAQAADCVIHCVYQDLWWTPEQFCHDVLAGHFLWGPKNFSLVPRTVYMAQLRQKIEGLETWAAVIRAELYRLEMNSASESPKTGSILEALKRAHAAGGNAWDDIDDPSAYLREIRGERRQAGKPPADSRMQEGHYVKLSLDILETPELTPAAKLIFAAIANRVGDNGECWPGQRQLAKDCGLGLKAANRAISELVAMGKIVREPGKLSGPRAARCCHYRLAPVCGLDFRQKS
jgi:DNA-binding MarR family transcriptional regulator